jgi:hypothetical protein
LALLTIFKYIVAGGNAAVQHLTAILTRSSSLDAAHIMSEILQLWLQYVDMREAHELLVEQTRLVTFNGDWVQSLNSFDPVLHSAPLLEETVCCHKKSLFFSKILKKQPSIHPFNDTALSSIIHFIIFAAKQSITLQWGLLDADALAVVLIAFVDGVPILSNLLDACCYIIHISVIDTYGGFQTLGHGTNTDIHQAETHLFSSFGCLTGTQWRNG